MELQPGPGELGQREPAALSGCGPELDPAGLRPGLALLCTYRYRQPLFGNEQYHYGIVGTDGVTLSRGGEE